MGVSLAFKSLTKLRDMMDLAGMTLASGWVYIARHHSTYAILSLIRYDWHIRDDYKGDFHAWALHFTWPIGALLMTSQFNVQRWWWRHNRPAIVTCTQINSLDIKNNAWVTVNNDFLVTSGVICQWFDEVTSKNHWQITSRVTKKSLFTVTNVLFYFLHAILYLEHTVPLRTIIDRSFRHCR